jgi:hypothetical protein
MVDGYSFSLRVGATEVYIILYKSDRSRIEVGSSWLLGIIGQLIHRMMILVIRHTLWFSVDHILEFNRTKEQCSLINNIVSFSATPLEYC